MSPSKELIFKGLYCPLLVPQGPWEHVSADFIIAFPRTQKGHDAIMVMVNWFTKVVHFVPHHNSDDASNFPISITKRSSNCMKIQREYYLIKKTSS